MSMTASEMGKKSAANRKKEMGEEAYLKELKRIAKLPRKRKKKEPK